MPAAPNTLRRQIPLLLEWFDQNQRTMPWRSRRTPYRVWVAEIMLQQTRVDQARPYYQRFMKRFPSLHALAQAPEADVLKAWEGLGYYSRARNLHQAARQIFREHGGRFPRTEAGLLSLPGIGGYTAAAIGSIAFNLPLAVLDGNVIRVLTRLTACPDDPRRAPVHRALQQLAGELLTRETPGRHNEAMMELGALLCLPRNPQCGICPLRKACRAHAENRTADFPQRPPPKKIPHKKVGAAVTVNRKGEVLIAQRRPEAMLGGLWEFPGGTLESGETIEACIRRELKEELDIEIETGPHLTTVRHAYSHFTIELHVHFARIRRGRPRAVECADFRWVRLTDLHRFAFSRADLHVLEKLMQKEIDAYLRGG